MTAIGVDVGGTSLRICLSSSEGVSSPERRVWSGAGAQSPQVLIEALRPYVDRAVRRHGGPVHLALGVAGQVSADGVLVRNAPNLGWRDVPLASLMMGALGSDVERVIVLNDLGAAALAEVQDGAAAGCSDALLVFVGTGVGAAIVLGGELQRGAGGFAGELGHVKVRGNDRPCGCGERGCVESLVGGRALERELIGLFGPCPQGLHPLEAWERMVEAGDTRATDLLHERAAVLGDVVAGAVTLLNPERVVLGGGVLFGMRRFRDLVVERVRGRALAVAARDCAIVMAAHGDEAGVRGALVAARRARGT
ncbi:MAG: ROK family protein [Deltaproteobacteria bacterium]|nr:MAG: ROK family protein [Deltaproteobacteria bacterium]